MRFSQKMGLNGFSELKIILKWENKNKVSDLDKTLENVCENYTRLMKEMSERNCDDICKQIYEQKEFSFMEQEQYKIMLLEKYVEFF